MVEDFRRERDPSQFEVMLDRAVAGVAHTGSPMGWPTSITLSCRRPLGSAGSPDASCITPWTKSALQGVEGAASCSCVVRWLGQHPEYADRQAHIDGG